MISYLIIVSDLLADLGRSVWGDCPQFFKDYRFWQAVVTVVVILPLCCVKKLDTMRFASLLAMVSVGYIVVLVVYFYFFGELSYEPEPIKLATFAPEAFAALPVFVFAFTCHVNLFPIYREMAHARFRRTQVVVIISLIICACAENKLTINNGGLVKPSLVVYYYFKFYSVGADVSAPTSHLHCRGQLWIRHRGPGCGLQHHQQLCASNRWRCPLVHFFPRHIFLSYFAAPCAVFARHGGLQTKR
eukprot:TRINITY_DN910_c0_g1_i10.p2 TRINITY_DN910_c0_g1~~TRINITY_DN910_c0_g1_i10.p2  ORF type:complete len:245 (-),score=11.82 TRINITY_DN910_c0_g1_i10:383-1117(-)